MKKLPITLCILAVMLSSCKKDNFVMIESFDFIAEKEQELIEGQEIAIKFSNVAVKPVEAAEFIDSTKTTLVADDPNVLDVTSVAGGFKVLAKIEGEATLTMTIADTRGNTFSSQRKVKVTCPYGYVDLGLSVKWATSNLGASKPEESGKFFSWGEVKTKDSYNIDTYIWCKGDNTSYTKYCLSKENGTVDNKSVLESGDDAATAELGGNWRMPTKAEFDELIKNCTWTESLSEDKSVAVYIIKSKTNNNSIILPMTGHYEKNVHKSYDLKSEEMEYMYWTNELKSGQTVQGGVFYADPGWWEDPQTKGFARYYGCAVRPVRIK